MLDPNLDLNTFELSDITFANQSITVPSGLDHYEAMLPFTANGNNILVNVQAALDRASRTLTLTLQAVDPATGTFPADPLVGLLYPNDDTGRGVGSLSYSARPLVSLPSGTVIQNRAQITFDYNDPIDTPLVHNTLDAGTPTSSVAPLPAVTNNPTLAVQWSGQDEASGSGIAGYDLYGSEDGGPFARLLTGTTATSATFTVDPGHTYAFYSIATDNVGHRQPTPATAQATTLVDVTPPTSTVAPLPPFSPSSFTVSWSGSDGAAGSGIASYDVFVSDNGGTFTAWQTATTQTSATFTGQDGHTYAFYSVATDRAGNREATPTTGQAATQVDATPPTSRVQPLPSTINTVSFAVSWSGSDGPAGSGVKSFDVLVSVDGAAFTPWLTGTAQTSATYTGSFGHRYGFVSVATDNAGNRQPTPATAQAETTLVAPPPPPTPTDRPITAQLVTVKVGKKKRLVVRVFYADTGAEKSEFASPFQKPAFRGIQITLRDSDGDGVPDTVVLTAKKGKRTLTSSFPA